MIEGAPPFDGVAYAPELRAEAASAWQSLLLQEHVSQVAAEQLVGDLGRFHAPHAIVASARRIAGEEARHVGVCSQVVAALGFEPRLAPVAPRALPTAQRDFERAMVDILVIGFAVGETMSVGGFVAGRALAQEPLARWALGELLRDEVGHGAFGEEAGAWAMRGWSAERRRSKWPRCVAAMESVERRVGGRLGECADERGEGALEALGVPDAVVVGKGLLRAVARWVLPRLERMGVLPVRLPSDAWTRLRVG